MSRGSMKRKGDEILIRLDSGANIHSCDEEIVSAEDLGFESRADWDAASEEEKFKAVQDYFLAVKGFPEFSWQD